MDAGIRVLSKRVWARTLQHATDAVQQLLDAGSGAITVVGRHAPLLMNPSGRKHAC